MLRSENGHGTEGARELNNYYFYDAAENLVSLTTGRGRARKKIPVKKYYFIMEKS